MPVPSPPTAFYHDMLLTEHWAITVDSSLRRDMSRLFYGKGLTFFNSSYAMRFYFSSYCTIKNKAHQVWSTNEECLRFGILPRDAVDPEEMVWLECKGPGHIWHTISAWEESGSKV